MIENSTLLKINLEVRRIFSSNPKLYVRKSLHATRGIPRHHFMLSQHVSGQCRL